MAFVDKVTLTVSLSLMGDAMFVTQAFMSRQMVFATSSHRIAKLQMFLMAIVWSVFQDSE